jgi:predicted amidohydrolase YtcJ
MQLVEVDNSKVKTIALTVFLALAMTLSGCGPAPESGADVVLTNARIYTVDENRPWAEAVAIQGDRFVYVGDPAGAEAFVGESTLRSDLGGRFVMPAIIDGHTHPGMMGAESFGPSLPGSGHEDLLGEVKAYAESEPGDGWIKLCCWSNYDYLVLGREPHKSELDAIVPDRPVWITSLSWHSYWLNSKGLETLGVDADSQDPAPGVAYYVRDKNGEPTGWIKEGAGWQFMAEQFPADLEQIREGIDLSLELLSTNGVTTVYDGGNFDYVDEVYGYLAELDAAGKLLLRYEGTYMVYLPERRHFAVQEMKRLREAYGGERLKFRTIKLFMDGINSNLSGGVLEPYVDHPDHVGATLLSVDELRDWLLELHEEKFDLHIHAIGDLAVRTALDGVEAARAIVGDEFYPRVTVAHLQVIDEADWPRFGELDVSANFTAWWHGLSAKDPSMALLGRPRSLHAYPANELIKTGGNVTFSSDDWTPDVLSPFLGIEVGHNRQFPDEWLAARGTTPDQFRPPASEQLDLEQMIRGYTIRGAYPFRMEDKLGSIEVGKMADLLVLDENPFEIDRRSIHRIKPAVVMMEGQAIHGELPQ